MGGRKDVRNGRLPSNYSTGMTFLELCSLYLIRSAPG